MFETSAIELDFQALVNNLQVIRAHIGEKVKISSVVKGNAYGHGIEEFVPIAEEAGINHFSVFSADEARRVRQVTDRSSIMIMGYIDNPELEWAVENEIEYFVFEKDRFQHSIRTAKKIRKKALIHLEIETGLNRTGFNRKQLKEIVPLFLENSDHLQIMGDCTHYAGAESIANYYRIKSQIKTFNKLDQWLNTAGLRPVSRHTACSAAAISYPQSRMDLVRIGILQYGFWPSPETFINYLKIKGDRKDPLKRIIKWKSRIMDVKEVGTGEFVGYGTTFMAPDNMKIATVPVGYAQGYSRSLSNQGRVLVRGKRLSVIGIVNMNHLMIDISECPEAEKGDEVVLIGDQGGLSVSVASFSELSDQLNYELLTRLPQSIPRRVINFPEKVTN